VVSMVGLIDDAQHVTRSSLSQAGQSIVLLGDLPHELGGSYFLQTQFGLKDGIVPEVDLNAEAKLQNFLISNIQSGTIDCAHDLAEGGLLVALVEMLFGESRLGANVNINSMGASSRLDALLFGESQGRVLIGVSPEHADSIVTAAQNAGVPAQVIGQSTEGQELSLTVNEQEIVNSSISKLQKIWEDAIPSQMESV